MGPHLILILSFKIYHTNQLRKLNFQFYRAPCTYIYLFKPLIEMYHELTEHHFNYGIIMLSLYNVTNINAGVFRVYVPRSLLFFLQILKFTQMILVKFVKLNTAINLDSCAMRNL